MLNHSLCAFCDSRGRIFKIVRGGRWATRFDFATDKARSPPQNQRVWFGGGACPVVPRPRGGSSKIVPPGVGPSLVGRLAAFLVAACPIGLDGHPVSRRKNAASRAARPTPGKSFHPCIARVFRRHSGNATT